MLGVIQSNKDIFKCSIMKHTKKSSTIKYESLENQFNCKYNTQRLHYANK